MRRLVVAVALLVAFSSMIGGADAVGSGQQKPTGHCAARKDIVGECSKIRGRLRAYTGYPRCRIWPVGSTHLLGVSDPSALPSNVACGEGFEVYADFLVCPVSEVKTNGMQMVCVGSASNIRASEIKQDESASR